MSQIQAPQVQAPQVPAPQGRAPWYTIVVAILILAAFAALCRYLLVEGVPLDPKTQQHQWDRMLIIFNAIQTMAAAAAGALLGTTVQQARVASAEQRAQLNEQDARKADAARKQIGNLQPPGAPGDAAQEKLRAVAAALV